MEHILVGHFSPSFLHITPPDQDGDIQIVICVERFGQLKIQQRITEVFALLYFKIPDIIMGRLIVVQAFSEPQMHSVLRTVFNEKK